MAKFVPPYNFVPVEISKAHRDGPIWHDVFPQTGKFSGRIRCSLYALTPVIVGNEQKESEHVAPADESTAGPDTEPKHKVIHPFRFPGGTYGIADSTLRGLFSNTYAAITNSPIERVNDLTFSFRPNAAFGPKEPSFAAGILYKEDNEWWALTFPIVGQQFISNNGNANAWLLSAKNGLSRNDWQAACPSGTVVLPCSGGLDGEGRLQAAFAGSSRPETSNCNKMAISVPALDIAHGKWHKLDTDVVELYEKTCAHLTNGHLDGHPKLTKKIGDPETAKNRIRQAIAQKRRMEPGRVVFVEIFEDRVISFGMNFRYRWRYRDSCAFYNKNLRNATIRPCFDYSSERGALIEDLRLTPRRRLFGFVDEGTDADADTLNALAGRVYFSCAEHVIGTGETQQNVTLKTLGSPKPSAYEFYLTQSSGSGPLEDYGDDGNPLGRGEPRGRKYYLHNPKAAQDPSCYSQVEQTALNQTAEVLLIPSRDQKAGTTRFPCFRFTVLFRNLDEKELHTLLLSLSLGNEKEAVADALEEEASLNELQLYKGERDLLAHKIGHAQPLGLGSVLPCVDRVEVLRIASEAPQWEDYSLSPVSEDRPKLPPALGSIAKFTPLTHAELAYPYVGQEEDDEGNIVPAVHKFHSAVRADHLKARRGANANPRNRRLPRAEDIRKASIAVSQERRQ